VPWEDALLWVWAVAAGLCAEVTELPPALGLRAGVRYSGSSVSGGLEEAGERVADRRVSRHDLDLVGVFSPTRGLALTLDLALTPSLRYRYAASQEMRIDPQSGAGSYLSGDPVAGTPTVRASGLAGVWLGVAGAPLSEVAMQRVGWRLDAAVRTPSPKRNLWSAPNGTRGPAPGGAAFRLAGAFSADQGAFAPWMRAEWTHEFGARVDVIDEDGVTWARDLQVRPARTFAASVGTEVVAVDGGASGVRVALDPRITAGYRSWEDVASGVYLPNVLAGGRAIPMTSGDTLFASAGPAVSVRVRERVRVRAGVDLSYTMPYRLEHQYDVRTTGDTLGVGGSFEVLGEGRLGKR
jgi:hypothetical protein